MDISELLIELFSRVAEHVDDVLDGAAPDLLTADPGEGANTVAWLVWHLTRVQDHHVAELMGSDQLWVERDGVDGWAARTGLEPDPHDTGYGHSPAQVAAVRPEDADVLRDYYTAVAARTRSYLEQLSAADLDRVIDERWDPPVTVGVRLVSVADDDIQHAGQAAYVRGMLERR